MEITNCTCCRGIYQDEQADNGEKRPAFIPEIMNAIQIQAITDAVTDAVIRTFFATTKSYYGYMLYILITTFVYSLMLLFIQRNRHYDTYNGLVNILI